MIHMYKLHMLNLIALGRQVCNPLHPDPMHIITLVFNLRAGF